MDLRYFKYSTQVESLNKYNVILMSHFAQFLVGAFSLKEKSPTLTVSSFFLFFSVDNLTLSGPLFLQFLFIFHICSSSIFDPAGERGFDSRTKP